MVFIGLQTCTVPSPGVDQSQSQSQRQGQGQHMVGPHEGPKEGSQQSDHIRCRQDKGVA